MAKDAKTRIAERTALAEERMQGQGAFGRIVTKIGLFTANTVDAITSTLDNDKAVFMGSTVSGMARGALYGALIAIVLLAIFNPVSANLLFLAAAGIGAVGYGIYDGQKGLEHHLNSPANPLPDIIAKTAGIVPEKEKAQEEQKDPTIPSFAAREEARRNAAAATQQR